MDKLKNFKENQDFELTSEYMKMMDVMIEKDKNGQIKYSKWDDVKFKLLSNKEK